MAIVLRKWQLSDIDNLVKYANNRKVADNLRDVFPHPYRRQDGLVFINSVQDEGPIKVFAIEYDGEAIGGIGVFPGTDVYRKGAEIGYWLAEPFWGRGIMLQAIQQILQYAFNTFDVTRVFAKPFGFNTASHKVLEKAGFTLEATLKNAVYKNGAYADELVYAITKM